MVAVPDGFLVPLKTKGSVTLFDLDDVSTKGQGHEITKHGEQWFYHRVEWRDMDKDGDLDILTARADRPIIPMLMGECFYCLCLSVCLSVCLSTRDSLCQ